MALAHWDNQSPTTTQQVYQQAIELDPSCRESWVLEHLQQAGFSDEQIQMADVVWQSLSLLQVCKQYLPEQTTLKSLFYGVFGLVDNFQLHNLQTAVLTFCHRRRVRYCAQNVMTVPY